MEWDEEALRKLRAKCAEEVKRINGTVSFEECLRISKRVVMELSGVDIIVNIAYFDFHVGV